MISTINENELRTSNIEVVKQYRADVPHADADPYQLQQVFLNIMNNARQAMEEAEIRGHIILRTVTEAGRVRVEILDNGPGIPAENIGKLFDPFFTTKALGKRTGLGLSVSYGIVKEHGGNIEVTSRLGEGTCFRIDLPVSTGAQPDRRLTEIAGDEFDECLESRKSVLIVDDEASILWLTSRILENWGYDVETASDGQEGLERIAHRSFDLVLCDWKMPVVNGQEFFLRLREKDPRAASRFIFMTGDVLNQRTSEFIESNGSRYLAKPFSVAGIKSAIHTLV